RFAGRPGLRIPAAATRQRHGRNRGHYPPPAPNRIRQDAAHRWPRRAIRSIRLALAHLATPYSRENERRTFRRLRSILNTQYGGGGRRSRAGAARSDRNHGVRRVAGGGSRGGKQTLAGKVRRSV